MAATRLRARLHAEQAVVTGKQTLSQLSVLGRVADAGDITVGELARVEHISQQSASEIVAALRRQGLITSRIDPLDRRRALLDITPAGSDLIEAILQRRSVWLACALDVNVSDAEWAILAAASLIMERLAACGPLPEEVRGSDLRAARAVDSRCDRQVGVAGRT
ncbi:MarR family winged helix-turn-helix transcriptional regulator [Nocardioides sp. AN3]